MAPVSHNPDQPIPQWSLTQRKSNDALTSASFEEDQFSIEDDVPCFS